MCDFAEDAKIPVPLSEVRGFVSDIQRYLNVLPPMHTVLRGIGVKVLLCIGFGERKLSEPIRFGT